ncbi:perlwapin-like [Haliotis rufescens]|uniref:perlwapin-like n=1 Tax=Haliotis rufescens TaxID=6454 RepID=UPI00201F5B22|nr:perlwapin-like [Haliotis rufescens]
MDAMTHIAAVLIVATLEAVDGTNSRYYSADVDFPFPGTYNCDVCTATECAPGFFCRAVGAAGLPVTPACVPAASIAPTFPTPKCARGGGDTAVFQNGSMISCSANQNCPLNFVCSSGACCLDISLCSKQGNCPARVSWCGVNNDCTSDSSCPGDTKCCSYPECQGRRCVRPLFTGR